MKTTQNKYFYEEFFVYSFRNTTPFSNIPKFLYYCQTSLTWTWLVMIVRTISSFFPWADVILPVTSGNIRNNVSKRREGKDICCLHLTKSMFDLLGSMIHFHLEFLILVFFVRYPLFVLRTLFSFWLIVIAQWKGAHGVDTVKNR